MILIWKLWCPGSSYVGLETKILLYIRREFLTCHTSCGIVLKSHCIRYQRNLSTWWIVTMIVFYGGFKTLWFASKVTFVSNMFVVCGIDMGLVWTISSVVSITYVLDWNMSLRLVIICLIRKYFNYNYH